MTIKLLLYHSYVTSVDKKTLKTRANVISLYLLLSYFSSPYDKICLIIISCEKTILKKLLT